jgi:hypothetical protein
MGESKMIKAIITLYARKEATEVSVNEHIINEMANYTTLVEMLDLSMERFSTSTIF